MDDVRRKRKKLEFFRNSIYVLDYSFLNFFCVLYILVFVYLVIFSIFIF